jgi:hypothetical protein
MGRSRSRRKHPRWRKILGYEYELRPVQVSDHCWLIIKTPVKIIYEGQISDKELVEMTKNGKEELDVPFILELHEASQTSQSN